MSKQMKQNRGVSLIVLVITIIVMIILATSIILSLNSSGILKKSNKAKRFTDYQTAKELAIMAKSDWDLMSDEQKTANGGTFSEYAQTRLQQAGFLTSGPGSYEVTNDCIVYAYPKIPAGFVASKATGETKVSEGLVIYEGSAEVTDANVATAQTTRNQYVWVPVPEINEFFRKDGYERGSLQSRVSSGDATEPYNLADTSSLTDAEKAALKKEQDEHAAMMESVGEYWGFYIARYEAGSSTERKDKANGTTQLIASQKDKYPYHYVGCAPSMTSASGDVTFSNRNQGKGAVELSRSIYPESGNYGVVSTLIYGVQWDAAIKFLSDVQNTTIDPSEPYIVRSTGMGWYNNYSSENPKHKTGIAVGTNVANKVKNIYDMGGNVCEWTMEAYKTTSRVYRGGAYSSAGYEAGYYSPASVRRGTSTNWTTDQVGFRVALYLK